MDSSFLSLLKIQFEGDKSILFENLLFVYYFSEKKKKKKSKIKKKKNRLTFKFRSPKKKICF